MSESKKISLPQTMAALSELSLALSELKNACESQTARFREKEKNGLEQLEICQLKKNMLMEVSKKTMENIEDIMQKIDKVLDK